MGIIINNILLNAFGRPKGILGKLGGMIMARANKKFAVWVINQLEIQSSDEVLEVGFGPGVAIQLIAIKARMGYVAGVDYSKEMVEQATARNIKVIEDKRVTLQYGSAESLPFEDNTFDKALAINSMQVWHDAGAGLREIRRVMKPGGKVALGFTPQSGQTNKGLIEMIAGAGFTETRVIKGELGFCALAIKA